LILIVGKDENAKFQGIDVRRLDELDISDLWPLGRLAMYSEQAVNELKTIEEKK